MLAVDVIQMSYRAALDRCLVDGSILGAEYLALPRQSVERAVDPGESYLAIDLGVISDAALLASWGDGEMGQAVLAAIHIELALEHCSRTGEPVPELVRCAMALLGMRADFVAGLIALEA